MAVWANIKKTLYYGKRNGWKAAWYAVAERLEERKKPAYRYIPPSEQELERQRMACRELFSSAQDGQAPPIFSILVPAYRTKEVFLRELIASLQAQTYPRWQLVIADATEGDSVKDVTEGYSDSRIKYVRLIKNQGISGNSNQGLAFAEGDYVGLLDHDDFLTKDALYEMYQAVQTGKNRGTEAKLLYSDEDKCDEEGCVFYEPNLKEDFNLDLLLSNNYICHFLVLRTELIRELLFRPEYDGAQDYDLVLRAVEKILASKEGQSAIWHIPKVLYHWRCHGASTAENPASKRYAYEAGRRALQDYADRRRLPAKAVELPHLGFYRLEYEEEVLRCRSDLGAVGGKLVHKGKIAGGRMGKDGTVFYEGLSVRYSGFLHRAVLTQDAEAVDIRLIRVAPSCYGLFEETVGVPYTQVAETDSFDCGTLPEGTDARAVSLAFCEALSKAGYRILWNPDWTRNL